MTVQKLLSEVITILENCENCCFDAHCLVEDLAKIPRGTAKTTHKDMLISSKTKDAVLQAAKRRADGYPLQYLLGNWDFLDLTLAVGEGVLIPRPETELLCETVAEAIARFPKRDEPVQLWDLCAGSGCIGLGISSLVSAHRLSVTEVELSDQAFHFLERNIQSHPQFNVRAVKADILADFDRFADGVDVIVSNPPYIKTGDLNNLQREVQYEPSMALDGSEDGLQFYRVIAEQWVPKLRDNGFVAVEIGIDQAQAVQELFEAANLHHINCINDYSDIPRIVIGYK